MSDQKMPPQHEPKPIPNSPDFPVNWENREDAQLPWQFDPMHIPYPIPPFEAEVWQTTYEGWNKANELTGVPIRSRGAYINTYMYSAFVPSIPMEEMPEAMSKSEEILKSQTGNLGELWQDKWLPDIQSHLDFWDSFDLQGADLQSLLSHLDETFERVAKLWTLHFQTVLPVYLGMS